MAPTNAPKEKKLGAREMKRIIGEILASDDGHGALERLDRFPAKSAVNPLFSLLLDIDEKIRHRAIPAMARVVNRMATENMEKARIIMRRFMWSLNDESGGIGWGAPESMAAVMAEHEGLAKEFGSVFVSYLNPDGNFLEHPPLQRGLLWGLAFVGKERPDMFQAAEQYMAPYFSSEDPVVRGQALRAAATLKMTSCKGEIEGLLTDTTPVRLLGDVEPYETTIADLARQAVNSVT